MKDVVILVGRQGAGKTLYCQTDLPNHLRVSQDEGPKRFERLFRRYVLLLDEGTDRIVIDRTNPTRLRRKLFAEAARSHGCHVKIVYFDVTREVCERRIGLRENHPTLGLEKMHEAIAHYEDRFEMPTEDECDELVIVRLDD